MLIALNILSLVWIIATWVKSGFLSALNLFLYGLLVAVGSIYYLDDVGRLLH